MRELLQLDCGVTPVDHVPRGLQFHSWASLGPDDRAGTAGGAGCWANEIVVSVQFVTAHLIHSHIENRALLVRIAGVEVPPFALVDR